MERKIFKPNLLREAIVSDRMTSRADGIQYRGCRGCCFAVLVVSASSHNFNSLHLPLDVHKVPCAEGFRNEVAPKELLLRERERLRPWMNSTRNTERRIDQCPAPQRFLQCRLKESTSIVSKKKTNGIESQASRFSSTCSNLLSAQCPRSWIGILV